MCARWVPSWSRVLGRVGLAVAPLQAPWVQERLRLPADQRRADIRLLFSDGRQLAGADVYRHLLRRLWWAYPLYLLAAAPGLRRLFDRVYRLVADRRLALSAACGLHPPARPETRPADAQERRSRGRR